jgi:hypothetical protein
VSETATTYIPETGFSASLALPGGHVHISTKTLAALTLIVGKLQPTEAAGPDLQLPLLPTVDEPEVKTPAPKPKKEAAAQVEKSAAAGPAPAASTAASPSAPAAASPSEAKGPDYNDVKAAVLALAKISPQLAKDTLAKFKGQNGEPCDHGTKLPLESYADFLAAAKEAQGVAA